MSHYASKRSEVNVHVYRKLSVNVNLKLRVFDMAASSVPPATSAATAASAGRRSLFSTSNNKKHAGSDPAVAKCKSPSKARKRNSRDKEKKRKWPLEVVPEEEEEPEGGVEDIEHCDDDWHGWVKDLNREEKAASVLLLEQRPVEEEPEEPQSALNPPETPKPPLFNRSFVYKHLKALNEQLPPVLERKEFLQLYKEALNKVESSLHQPLEEVWEQAQEGVVQGLFWRKLEIGSEEGEEGAAEREAFEEQERQSLVSKWLERVDTMDTPMLGQFLVAVNGFVQVKNEAQLADYLALEPPFGEHYGHMIRELKQQYPKGAEDALEKKCSQSLPAAREGEDGAPWTQFIKFMVQYLSYLRDVDADPNKYLHTYDLLSELQARVNSALVHPTLGHLVLPVVVRCARLVCRLAIGLDKQPELIAHLKSGQPGGEDGGPKETLPERAANTLRTGFVTCLNDRSSGIGKDGKPEGKKRGIYTIANLCLKILFQCNKTRNATQIFANMSTLSPPISAYPKRERVTYLYYLGRFYWQNSHFYRAQLVLQAAYDEAPSSPQCVRQRRIILVYLIASNLVLGRFPSEALLSRPEAQGLADRFLPICFAIRKGDLASFRRHLDLDGEHADWFLHFRILLQLRNRCEVLVWRGLVRKTFLFAGTVPRMEGNSRAAPTVNIADLVTVWRYLEKRATAPPQNGEYVDPDFQSLSLSLPEEEANLLLPDNTSLESVLSSLLDQGLLNGFLSHKQQKYAITGSKTKGGPLAAGFPVVWEVIKKKAEAEGQGAVPGWKKDSGVRAAGGVGPGMVIKLSGARGFG